LPTEILEKILDALRDVEVNYTSKFSDLELLREMKVDAGVDWKTICGNFSVYCKIKRFLESSAEKENRVVYIFASLILAWFHAMGIKAENLDDIIDSAKNSIPFSFQLKSKIQANRALFASTFEYWYPRIIDVSLKQSFHNLCLFGNTEEDAAYTRKVPISVSFFSELFLLQRNSSLLFNQLSTKNQFLGRSQKCPQFWTWLTELPSLSLSSHENGNTKKLKKRTRHSRTKCSTFKRPSRCCDHSAHSSKNAMMATVRMKEKN
jgi:hypothetical protein